MPRSAERVLQGFGLAVAQQPGRGTRPSATILAASEVSDPTAAAAAAASSSFDDPFADDEADLLPHPVAITSRATDRPDRIERRLIRFMVMTWHRKECILSFQRAGWCAVPNLSWQTYGPRTATPLDFGPTDAGAPPSGHLKTVAGVGIMLSPELTRRRGARYCRSASANRRRTSPMPTFPLPFLPSQSWHNFGSARTGRYASAHPACDLKVPAGTEIYAVADGVVVGLGLTSSPSMRTTSPSVTA